MEPLAHALDMKMTHSELDIDISEISSKFIVYRLIGM